MSRKSCSERARSPSRCRITMCGSPPRRSSAARRSPYGCCGGTRSSDPWRRSASRSTWSPAFCNCRWTPSTTSPLPPAVQQVQRDSSDRIARSRTVLGRRDRAADPPARGRRLSALPGNGVPRSDRHLRTGGGHLRDCGWPGTLPGRTGTATAASPSSHPLPVVGRVAESARGHHHARRSPIHGLPAGRAADRRNRSRLTCGDKLSPSRRQIVAFAPPNWL